MKKITSLLLATIVSVAFFTACGKTPNPQNTNEDTISMVSTIFAPYDFVREIVGDNAAITMLPPPGSESHSYEPTPQDIITVQNCDVFIYVGGDTCGRTKRSLWSVCGRLWLYSGRKRRRLINFGLPKTNGVLLNWITYSAKSTKTTQSEN